MIRKWLILLSVFAILVPVWGMNATAARAQTNYISYVVQRGDTLGKLAYSFCTNWRDIYDLNRDTIGKNPNVILPNMVLLIPNHFI